VKEAFRRYGLWLTLALAFHAALLLVFHLRIVLEAAAGPESDSAPIDVAVVESAPATEEAAPPDPTPPEPVTPPTPVPPPPPPPEPTPEPVPEPAPPKPEPMPRPAPPVAHQPKPPTHSHAAVPAKSGSAAASANPGPPTAAHGSGGTGRTEVRIRSNPKPDYPEEAKRAHEEGVAIVSIEINGEGIPESVTLSKSSGFPILDQAALAGVRRWRFYPAVVGGLPISVHKEVPVRFRIAS